MLRNPASPTSVSFRAPPARRIDLQNPQLSSTRRIVGPGFSFFDGIGFFLLRCLVRLLVGVDGLRGYKADRES